METDQLLLQIEELVNQKSIKIAELRAIDDHLKNCKLQLQVVCPHPSHYKDTLYDGHKYCITYCCSVCDKVVK